MKNILVLSATLMILVSCKKEDKFAPGQLMKAEADSKKKYAAAVTEQRYTGLLAMNDVPNKSAEFYKWSDDQQPEYTSYGKKITPEKAITNIEMLLRYESLKLGDTAIIKFASKINSVCKKKGCWMKMELPEGKEAFVRFKDYEFFVPLNADNSNAIISGKAYIEEISIDELRHYAKDGGKSQEEINKINSPEITYAFLADGVLLQK